MLSAEDLDGVVLSQGGEDGAAGKRQRALQLRPGEHMGLSEQASGGQEQWQGPPRQGVCGRAKGKHSQRGLRFCGITWQGKRCNLGLTGWLWREWVHDRLNASPFICVRATRCLMRLSMKTERLGKTTVIFPSWRRSSGEWQQRCASVQRVYRARGQHHGSRATVLRHRHLSFYCCAVLSVGEQWAHGTVIARGGWVGVGEPDQRFRRRFRRRGDEALLDRHRARTPPGPSRSSLLSPRWMGPFRVHLQSRPLQYHF
jgi:hypothetical protein